jgi:hypothetical protein
MNTGVSTPQALLKRDFDLAQAKRAVSEAFRFKQLQIAFEKMGASVGMWYQRFTRKKPEAPFAWINSGPALPWRLHLECDG